MAIQIKIRRDTKAEWDSADPVLLAGELGFELKDSATSGRFKIGNGSREWSRLPFWYAYQDSAGAYGSAGGGAAATWYGDRAIIGTSTASLANVQYYDITTTGNSSAFGTLINNRTSSTGVLSDTTYALFGGGYNNDIDYVTISTTGNGSDFGDLTVSRGLMEGSCDGTYGIWGGGYSSSGHNTIDYVTTATPGNALDFGDLSSPRNWSGAFNNGTYGLFAGGYDWNTSSNVNVIDYVTMTSPGNASDFGDLTASAMTGACSNSTYGLIHLNYTTGSIDYITMATPGNASDFGDLATTGREFLAACANATRATFNGGDGGETVIDYVTIATPSNATDFGDLTYNAEFVSGASGSPS